MKSHDAEDAENQRDTAIAGDNGVNVNTASEITCSDVTDKANGKKAKGERINQRTNQTYLCRSHQSLVYFPTKPRTVSKDIVSYRSWSITAMKAKQPRLPKP